MLETLHDKLANGNTFLALVVAISIVATILTIAMPLLDTDQLGKRMKSVATERERIRARERERLATKDKKVALRSQPKVYMKQLVEGFSLERWLGTEQAKAQLTMAGFRGKQAEVAFLFFRAVAPIGMALTGLIYTFGFFDTELSTTMKIGSGVFGAFVGIKTPELFLKNKICVESGMSIEPAFRKVSLEIGIQSVELAEEFALTTAELSYLPDRRTAYDNLAARTGLEGLRQVSTVLVQAEKYGTPLGQALRVVSQEGRDQRLMEAEKKAASLPPKLTVPMIVFFLPILFAVILTPAIIQVQDRMN